MAAVESNFACFAKLTFFLDFLNHSCAFGLVLNRPGNSRIPPLLFRAFAHMHACSELAASIPHTAAKNFKSPPRKN